MSVFDKVMSSFLLCPHRSVLLIYLVFCRSFKTFLLYKKKKMKECAQLAIPGQKFSVISFLSAFLFSVHFTENRTVPVYTTPARWKLHYIWVPFIFKIKKKSYWILRGQGYNLLHPSSFVSRENIIIWFRIKLAKTMAPLTKTK